MCNVSLTKWAVLAAMAYTFAACSGCATSKEVTVPKGVEYVAIEGGDRGQAIACMPSQDVGGPIPLRQCMGLEEFLINWQAQQMERSGSKL